VSTNVDVSYESWVSCTGMRDPIDNMCNEKIKGNRLINIVVQENMGLIESMFHDREIDQVIKDEIWGNYPVLSALVYCHSDLTMELVRVNPEHYVYQIYPQKSDSYIKIWVHFHITGAFKPYIEKE